MNKKALFLLFSIIIALYVSISNIHHFVIQADGDAILSFKKNIGTYVNNVQIHNGYAFVTSYEHIEIYSTDNNVDLVGSITVPGCYFNAIDVSGNYAYVSELQHACEGNFYVFDISDPNNPLIYGEPVNTSNIPGQEIVISGQYAYLASAQDGLVVVDISDPANPNTRSQHLPHTGFVYRDLAVDAANVYLANSTGGYAVVDVVDPSNPITETEVDVPGVFADYHSNAIAMDEEYLYIAGGERLLKIFNASTGEEIFLNEKENTWSTDVEKVDDYLFVVDRDFGVIIFDVNDPEQPLSVWEEEISPRVKQLSASQRKLFVITDSGTVDVFDMNIGEEEEPEPDISFLDLPWDYRAQGKTFSDAALSMSSYFDHEYPLVSASSILGLDRPALVNFKGKKSNLNQYSSHDGYDWGRLAGTKFGMPQVAGADGVAHYVDSCDACGHAIHIDHGNGYQTRHYHLQSSGLVTSDPSVFVPVVKGQQIGLTGFSGNTLPSDERGSHIHFMVVQDKDSDGEFDDNIPDGLVDPFGWQSNDTDPWEVFTFEYNNQLRTGNKSDYLWIHTIDRLFEVVPDHGGEYSQNRYKVIIPDTAYQGEFTVNMSSSPIIALSDSRNSVMPSLIVLAHDGDSDIKQFESNIYIYFDFHDVDLSDYDLSTLEIYSSQDGESWKSEDTDIDLNTKVASVQVSHLTEFALFADRLDSTAPFTEIMVEGDEGNEGWYRSDVKVYFDSNEDTSDIAYTAYSINNEDWHEYDDPITFSQDGVHVLQYYSEDSAGNVEDIREYHFSIDRQIPEVKIQYNTDTQMLDIAPMSAREKVSEVTDGRTKYFSVIDMAGNELRIEGRYKVAGPNKYLSIRKLVYNDREYFVDSNKFAVKEANNKLFQSWLTRDFQIRLSYPYNSVDTRVHMKKTGVHGSIIEEGQKLLYLVTDNGSIFYGYE